MGFLGSFDKIPVKSMHFVNSKLQEEGPNFGIPLDAASFEFCLELMSRKNPQHKMNVGGYFDVYLTICL